MIKKGREADQEKEPGRAKGEEKIRRENDETEKR